MPGLCDASGSGGNPPCGVGGGAAVGDKPQGGAGGSRAGGSSAAAGGGEASRLTLGVTRDAAGASSDTASDSTTAEVKLVGVSSVGGQKGVAANCQPTAH